MNKKKQYTFYDGEPFYYLFGQFLAQSRTFNGPVDWTSLK